MKNGDMNGAESRPKMWREVVSNEEKDVSQRSSKRGNEIVNECIDTKNAVKG